MPPYIESVSRTPLIPNYDEEVEVEAVVFDNVGVNMSLLFYRYDDQWINLTMSRSGNNFTAIIPALPYNTHVVYKICAKDVNDIWAVSELYSYTVEDFVAPEIAVEWKPTCPYPYWPSNITRVYEPVLITANVSEPVNASEADRVFFSYRVDGGEWWNTTMTYNATSGLWTTIIPGQLGNTTVEFFIRAYDKAGNMNVSSIYSYPVILLVIGDVNGDGIVNIVDIVIVAIHFGEKA